MAFIHSLLIVCTREIHIFPSIASKRPSRNESFFPFFQDHQWDHYLISEFSTSLIHNKQFEEEGLFPVENITPNHTMGAAAIISRIC